MEYLIYQHLSNANHPVLKVNMLYMEHMGWMDRGCRVWSGFLLCFIAKYIWLIDVLNPSLDDS